MSRIRNDFLPWREISFSLMILLEVSWLLPWYFLLSGFLPGGSVYRVGSILAGMILSCFLILQWLAVNKITRIWRVFVLVLLLLVWIILGGVFVLGERTILSISELVRWSANRASQSHHLPQAFVLLVMIFLAFQRGIVLSQGIVNPEMVRSTLTLAIGMDFLAILFHTANPEWNLTGFVLCMIFTGVTTMSAARLNSLSVHHGKRQLIFRGTWLVGIFLAALLLVTFSYLLALLVNDRFDWLLFVIRIPLLFIAILAVLLLLPFLWLFSWILEVTGSPEQILDWIYVSIMRLSSLVEKLVTLMTDWIKQFGLDGFLASVLPYVRVVLLWGFILGFLGWLIWWATTSIARELERRKRLPELRQMDEAGSVSLHERIQRQVNQARQLLSGWHMPGSGSGGRIEARIRRIFADLLKLSRDLGYPRPEGATPLEFLPTMKSVFINLEDELQRITEAYLLVRYGEFDESQLDLAQVEIAWNRVSSQAKVELLRMKQTKG